jgi:predicted Zn-dependent protease
MRRENRPPARPEIRNALSQAAQTLKAGHIGDAIAHCDRVLESVPDQPDALHLMAMAYAAGGDAEGAIERFQQSLAAAPRRHDVHINFGNFLREQGRIQEARHHLRRAVKLAPDFAHGWYYLALLCRAVGDSEEALRCAHKVTVLGPNGAEGWELLAAVQQARGNLNEAIQACREGLKHVPQAPRLHYSLGQLLRQECEFEESASAYAAARDAGFAPPELFVNQAEAHLEAGDLEAALSCADTGVELFPDHAVLQRTRARLHFESGAPGDPVAPLWQAAREHSDNAPLWYSLVRLLERLGRDEESDAALAEGRRLGCPSTAEIRMLEAWSRAKAGEQAEATEAFRAILEEHSGHSGVKLTFASHLLGHGDPAEAEALCASVLQTDPTNQLAWCYRGTAWQLLDDPREQWLLDYDRMVSTVEVPPPDGYSDTPSFMADVQAALESLHHTQARPIDQSVRGGTQTNGFLFRLKHPLLRILEAQIRVAAAEVLAKFPNEPDHPFWGRRISAPRGDGFRFSGAWSVRLDSEGYHANHIHTLGWISSAFYIALPQEVRQDATTAGHIQFGVPMAELDVELPPKRIVQPRVGTLVLFPSYMWHGTIPFTSDQARITVAFDLQPEA